MGPASHRLPAVPGQRYPLRLAGQALSALHVAATYNLAFNASLMVADGMGYALCLDRIISTDSGELIFRPLHPAQRASMSVIWKKYQVFSKASECFLAALREELR